MEAMKLLEQKRARKVVESSPVRDYLKYLGLFHMEITNFSRSINLSSLSSVYQLNCLKGDKISEDLISHNASIDGRPRKTDESVYYTGLYLGSYTGYSRIFYEMLDSDIKNSPAHVLASVINQNGTIVPEVREPVLSPAYLEKLSRFGFVKVKSGFKSDKLTNVTPTELGLRVFSSDTRKAWEGLKEWEFRIRLW